MILSCPLTWTRSVSWQHILTGCACTHNGSEYAAITATYHNFLAITATSLQRGPIGPRWREVAVPIYDLYRRLRLQFLELPMMGAVTPETYRVTLQ